MNTVLLNAVPLNGGKVIIKKGGSSSGNNDGEESVFFFDGKEFVFQSGMTWSEYIDSDYNNGDFYNDGGWIGYVGGYYVGDENANPIYLTDLITPNYEYYKGK